MQTQTSSSVSFPKRSSNMAECIQEFIDAMARKGIYCREEIIADEELHRFASEGKGDKDCWYVFHGAAGAFGDWSRDIHEKWNLANGHSYFKDKKDLNQQIAEAKKVAEEEIRSRNEDSAITASNKWKTFAKEGQSPYLQDKKVEAFGICFHKDFVVIPLRDTSGKLWSLQWIAPDGTKRFLKGGRKKGCFHHIGTFEEGQPVYITEGYATGASVYMATQSTTVIAFDAGNIESIVIELSKTYPNNPLVIAGDDDCWGTVNIGRETAQRVAIQHGISLVFPSFQDTSSRPTDFNDLHVLEGLDVVKRQVESHMQPSSQDWPDPIPLKNIKRDLSPVLPLPPSLIPEPYQDWLTDIAERMQCPLDYVAVGSIIVTASLIGAGCSIKPKREDSWTVIPNLWGGIVGAPSTLKSPALKEILRPLETLEEEARAAYESDLINYHVELESFKASKEVIKKDMMKAASASDKLAMDLAKDTLRRLVEPEYPLCKRYSTNDATIEKMHELLSKNERGLLLFRDELMGLLTSWDKEGHESDRSFYLEAWNGYGSKTTDRIGRGTIHTKNLCISLLGSTQPSKLLYYFQNALSGVDNDGLLQRFQLLVYPDEAKNWKLIDRKPNEHAQHQAVSLMVKLAKMDFNQLAGVNDTGSGIPYFHFDRDAQDIFYEWLTELEEKLRNCADDPILIEHLTKYRKLMPSLALIFHLINLANGNPSGPVTVDCVGRAAGWCDYLEAHARRIFESALSSCYQGARNLAKKIQAGELEEQFDKRDIYRKHWSFLKSKEEVELACDLLIENGWLREGVMSEGRKSKTCYLINPKLKKVLQ